MPETELHRKSVSSRTHGDAGKLHNVYLTGKSTKRKKHTRRCHSEVLEVSVHLNVTGIATVQARGVEAASDSLYMRP